MSANNCSDHADCLITLDDGSQVQKFCFEEMLGTSDTFFCDCNNRYGYHGERCDKLSIQVFWNAIIASLTLVISAIGIGWALKASFQHRRSMCDSHATRRTICQLLYATLITVILCHICHGVRMILLLVWIARPDLTETYFSPNVIIEDDDVGVLGPSGLAFVVLGGYGFVFFAFSMVLIASSWLATLQKATRVFAKDVGAKLQRFQFRAVSFFIVWSILIFVMTVIDLLIMQILVGFGGFVAIFVSAYSRYWFVKVVNRFMGSKHGEDAVLLIEKYSKRHNRVLYVMLNLNIVDLVVGTLYGDVLQPGTFNYSRMFFDFNFLMAAILMVMTTRFVSRVLANQSKHRKSQSVDRKSFVSNMSY